jgi:hypothetical protein
MRKTLWIIALVLVAAIGAPNAHADSFTNYTINFTLSSGSPLPTTGSIVYDTTTNQFTSFNVVWDTITFNLTSSANSPTLSNIFVPPTACLGTTSAQNFLLLLSGCGTQFANTWQASVLSEGTTFVDRFTIQSLDANRNGLGAQGFMAPVGGESGTGTLTITQQSEVVPEPGAGILTLIGIGSGWVMRKRIALGL